MIVFVYETIYFINIRKYDMTRIYWKFKYIMKFKFK